LRRRASADEIKSAFQVARKHHPDMAKPKEKVAAEERFKQINEAYEVLSDPEKRAPGDSSERTGISRADSTAAGLGPGRNGRGFRRHAGGNGGGVEFEFRRHRVQLISSRRFSAADAASRPWRRVRPAAGDRERGQDVEADIMVTLEEALNGSTRQVSLRRSDSEKVETYQVKIPRGVHEGQRIRLAGQGEAGARGGKKGDLFLRVRLARHPDFSVEGNDLVYEAALTPSQAVLGTEIEVPTLEGYRRLKISPGTQAGQRFRLRDRGLPAATGDRGNLYVVTQITIPKKLSEAERAIWQQLAAQRSSQL
jgi:curved DNA-binding protein